MLSYNYPKNKKNVKELQNHYSNQMGALSWEPDLTISKTMVGRGDQDIEEEMVVSK